MGRRHSHSKVRSDSRAERSKRSNRKNKDHYDESDHSSVFSNAEDFSADEYDYQDGHSDYGSKSDGSYNRKNQQSRNRGYRNDHSNHLENDSDSDGSDSFRLGKRGDGKGSRSRRDYEDRNSDNRSVFSARIERIKMEHDDSSFNSADGSESESQSARKMRHSDQKPRRSKSNPNHLESSHRSLLLQKQQSMRSLGQMSTNLNSLFHSPHQMQTPITPGNNQMLMRSSSSRSLGGGGQTIFHGQQYPMANQALVNQSQPHGHNIEGSQTPRIQIGPGHLTRSMSGRSLNSFASGQVQLNRSTRNLNVQSPLEVSPGTMLGKSQLSQGTKDGKYRPSLPNALPGPPVYAQQAGVMNMPSQNILIGNQDIVLNSSMNSQRPGFVRSASKGNVMASDMILKSGMRPDLAGLVRMASQKGFVNNKPLNSPRPDLRRVSSERSLGNGNAFNTSSIHSNPNMRIDSNHQPMIRNQNQLQSVPSVTGDSVLVVPDMMENISNLTSSRRGSQLSTRSRRSSPPESLVDQIYSRSQGRHGDAHSQGNTYDPPGEDSFRWDGRSVGMYSDDLTYDSYRSDRKSYVADPPDMYDKSPIYSDISGDELDRDKCDESCRSTDDRQDIFDEEDLYGSRFNEGDLGSVSHSSRSSYRRQEHGRRSRKSSKRGDPIDSDLVNKPERAIHSKERDSKKKNDDVTSAQKQPPMNWLAQQISTRKLADTHSISRHLEPEGASTIREDISSSKSKKSHDAGGFSGSVCDIQDDSSVQRHKSEIDGHGNLLSKEVGHVSTKKPRDPVSFSVRVRSDDSTNTTDTMSREIPSVILSVQDGPTQERSSKTKRAPRKSGAENKTESKGPKGDHKKTGSRKPKKTRSNASSNQEHIDRSVMGLIDQLKSLECQV